MDARIAALDALFDGHVKSDGPGLVVAAAVDGRVVYRRAFGMACVALGRALAPSTRMRIGSTSKQFTAMAVLLLADEGRVDLDAPLRDYLPELPRYPVEPTVRQVLQHLGGIRDHVSDGMLVDGGRSVKPAGWAWRHLVRQDALNGLPGQRWMYSNGGYHLLSLLAERAGGRPFAELLRDRLFAPLGMHDTALVPSDLAITPGLATLHVPQADGTWRRGAFPHEDLLGEGGIVSTADDLLRWLAELRAPRVLGTPAAWRTLLEPARLADGSALPYLMGLLRLPMRGEVTLQHAGAVVGASCQALTVPARGIDIVVLTNGLPVSPTAIAGQVLGVLLDAADRPAPEPARPKTRDYAALPGRRYRTPSGMVLAFADADGVLALSVLGNRAQPLRLASDGFVLAYEDCGAGPFFVSGVAHLPPRAPTTLRVGEGAVFETARLVPPADAVDWDELAGDWRCADLGTEAGLEAGSEDALLTVRGGANRLTLRLAPCGPDLFQWHSTDAAMPLTGMLHAVRTDGRVTALQCDAWGSRGLRYDRADGAHG
ncbi:CubicO group peptidase, beta-lactamase class C family [Massilia sp. PDC64]|nr:serine hydrolase [Massilia sp. PDC64]SDE80237.1 CubicO group peptidase, beta-lactamase class C family [Massilia sp. PDC64]